MTRPLLIAVLVSGAMAGAVGAAEKTEPAVRERAVISCVREVRQKYPQSRFDAHVTLRNDIHFSGNDEEQADFRACLQRLGQSVKAESPKSN